jgi:Cu/Ag efflux pump CusA
MDVPEVASVGRRTGRAELDEHAEGVHFSEIDVDLKPSTRSRDQVLADVRARLTVLPASVSVDQPIAHRMDHMLSGVGAEIALKIFGENLDALRDLAEMLRQKLTTIKGLADLQTEKQNRIPQLRVASPAAGRSPPIPQQNCNRLRNTAYRGVARPLAMRSSSDAAPVAEEARSAGNRERWKIT